MRAAPLFLVLACCQHQHPADVAVAAAVDVPASPVPAGPTMRVDSDFARLVLAHRAGEPGLEDELAAHPALAAMVKHQRMSGHPSPDPAELLGRILVSDEDLECGAVVLEHWQGREDELVATAMEAMDHLPSATVPGAVVYLELGYEIGFVAPPAIALNVGHPHFCAAPGELAFYALHEHHHLGFLQWAALPDLSSIDTRHELLDLVRFATWMEGTAVHAAYDARLRAGALGADPDYGVYGNPEEAARVEERFDTLVAIVRALDPVNPPALEAILGPMSSGERVWYRYGALLAWEVERTEGREGLRRRLRDGEGLPSVPRALSER